MSRPAELCGSTRMLRPAVLRGSTRMSRPAYSLVVALDGDGAARLGVGPLALVVLGLGARAAALAGPRRRLAQRLHVVEDDRPPARRCLHHVTLATKQQAHYQCYLTTHFSNSFMGVGNKLMVLISSPFPPAHDAP